MAFSRTVTDPVALSEDERWRVLFQRLDVVDAQILLLSERLNSMSQVATDTQAAVAALNAKVDTFIAAVQPAITALTSALAAAQAQITTLTAQLSAEQADDAADTTTLTATISDAQAEAAKVQAAIDALSTPTP